MPNITVSVSDEDYRAARIWAATHDTSVSAIVRTILQNLPEKPEDLPSRVPTLARELSHSRVDVSSPAQSELLDHSLFFLAMKSLRGGPEK